MSRHETEMHRDRRELIAALRAVMQAHIGANIAEATTPELRAACANARRILARFPQPKCDDGLFGDRSQMDLADRRDLK